MDYFWWCTGTSTSTAFHVTPCTVYPRSAYRYGNYTKEDHSCVVTQSAHANACVVTQSFVVTHSPQHHAARCASACGGHA